MRRIFCYIAHKSGVTDDSGAELLAAAKRIDSSASPTAILTGSGSDLDVACASLRSSYPEIWKVSNEALSYPNAELVRQALTAILPAGSIVLLPHDHFGMDLGPGLAIKLDSAFVSDVIETQATEENTLVVIRQEFGGQFSTHVTCDISTGAVITLRPGAFKATSSIAVVGAVVDKSTEVGVLAAKRRYRETIVAEAGDVDITKHAVLVSVGRGIQDKENIALAEELAEALGAAVSCSRPVVDAKWLPKSRQVGTSGKTVKPKVYLACGISGQFQHLAGLKGNPFIVAINKNPKAPIFQTANVGIIADILDLLPALTKRVRELRSSKQSAAHAS